MEMESQNAMRPIQSKYNFLLNPCSCSLRLSLSLIFCVAVVKNCFLLDSLSEGKALISVPSSEGIYKTLQLANGLAKMRSVGSSNPAKGIAAIVGVGPKLGRSIAGKFAHEGYTVAILARDLGRLSRFADEIAREEKAQVFAIRIDCSDTRSIKEAFEGVLSLGFVEVLIYNAYQPSSWHPTSFTDIRVNSFEKSLAVSSVGAFHCAQQVLTGMVERGRGTILFTGCSASLNGIAGFTELCCGKFALRALSQCLAREFQPHGVHVAHVIIDGLVGPPRGPSSLQRASVGEQQQQSIGGGALGTEVMTTMMDPDSLAQTYWHLHVQDRTGWTQEIDLRPSNSSPRYY